MLTAIRGPSEHLDDTVWMASYMDDITIAVPARHAPIVSQRVVEICESHRLVLNVDKCRVIGLAMPRYLDANPFTQAPAFPLRPDGDSVLGNPVGTKPYCKAECARAATTAAATLRAFDALQLSCRTGVQLTRFCINPRVQYLVRVHEAVDLFDILQRFDSAIDSALWKLAHHDPNRPGQHPMRGAVSSLLRSLPLDMGGLGIARHSWVAGHTGKASSRLLTVQFLDAHDTHEPWLDILLNSFAAQDFNAGCPLPLTLEENDDVHIATMHDQFSDALDHPMDLDGKALREMRNQILYYHSLSLTNYIKTNFSVAQAAWFASSQFDGSGRWLGSLAGAPQHPSLVLSDREYHTALRMRLLLQNAVTNDALTLPTHCRCRPRTPLIPTEPLHMLDELDCNHRFFQARHNACRDLLARVFKRMPGFQSVAREVTLPGQDDVAEQHRTRADLVVTWRGGPDDIDHSVVLDVAVGNPAAVSYRTRHQGHVNNPPWKFFGAAISREIEKQARYAPLHLGEGFVPFAIDATGRLGPAALSLITQAFRVTDTTPIHKNQVTYLQARLGMACMKINAQIVNLNAHMLFAQSRAGDNAVD